MRPVSSSAATPAITPPSDIDADVITVRVHARERERLAIAAEGGDVGAERASGAA